MSILGYYAIILKNVPFIGSSPINDKIVKNAIKSGFILQIQVITPTLMLARYANHNVKKAQF